MDTSLQALQSAVWHTAEDRGWHEGETNLIPVKLALIHSEVSEALEEYRNSDPACEIRHMYFNDGSNKPEGFGVELADIVIRVLDLAGIMGMDLTEIMLHKMEYNESRPHKHGGKRV